MKNKMKMLLMGALVVSSVNAQVLKVWKNDSATNFNVSTQVDSIAFASDSLELFGAGSDVSYSVNEDLDSVTFAEGIHYGSMTDERDGKVYKTMKIGNQTWMAENLNYGSFVRVAQRDEQYQSGSEKYCFDNLIANCDFGGGLYQWHTAMNLRVECSNGYSDCGNEISIGDHRGSCPLGWHIPKKNEWDELEDRLGEKTAGLQMKHVSGGGNNLSGFSAVATGYRSSYGQLLSPNSSNFWTAMLGDDDENPYSSLYSAYYRSLVGRAEFDGLFRSTYNKGYSFSVRCLKD